MDDYKNRRWNFNREIDFEPCGLGIQRKILAYTDELMCVENHFETCSIGALHTHPHTQVSYVVSGSFTYIVDGVSRNIHPGDSVLIKDNVLHGLTCQESGIVLDIFTPMREDFVK